MNKQSTDTPPQKRRRGRPRLQAVERQDRTATVQALERGLYLLQLLSKSGSASLSELAAEVELPASTAYRMLLTLQKLEFVTFDELTQKWSVGIEAFAVGSTYLNRANVTDASRAVMRQLMLATGETANLGILSDDGRVTFLTQIECKHPIRAFHLPGSRSPCHSSGIGKALLAELPADQVASILQKTDLPAFTDKTLTSENDLLSDLEVTFSRGWAFDDEERHVGMRCVAAAIHNTRGDAIAALSISGPTVRFADDRVAALGQQVRDAAAEVTRLIGGIDANAMNRK